MPPPKTAIIHPVRGLGGRLRPPGDKSISHRALMLGGLCEGVTEIEHLLEAADTRSTAAAMGALGVRVEGLGSGRVGVIGCGKGRLCPPQRPIDCGNSGTTMRLLAGLLAGQGIAARLVGDESLSRRPMGRIVDPLKAMGVEVRALGEGRRPPVEIAAGQGGPTGIEYDSPVASAQVKSCVLLAGLGASGTVVVCEPSPSRDHTERMLRYLGYDLTTSPNYATPDGSVASVTLRPDPAAPAPLARPISVPGDISSAAFMLVAAALTRSEGLVLEAVSVNPTRTGILTALEAMGVVLERSNPRVLPGGEPVADLQVRAPRELHGARIGGGLIPRLIDEIPALAVLATGLQGETVITDARELRVKESDRLAATGRLLRAAGARFEEEEDGLSVVGPVQLRAFTFDAEGDHRMAMAAAVAGLVADGPCEILGADACAVSYAGFFDDLASIRQEERA